MTFLQPLLLFGLPLIALPVLIHLFNRLRYRTMAWAAMMFLLSATRQSTRHEKLRHILVLVCRTLAVLALLLAMARPLIGGWLGWAMSAAPDTVVLLLDRSASMEQLDVVNQKTKRELAIERFREAAGTLGQGSRYVLIDSATRQPQEISGPDILSSLTLAGPSDTASDIPAMLESAVDYVTANQPGETEIWLASDFQSADWQPGNARWDAFRERVASLPQQVRVRLLAMTEHAPENIAITMTDVRRQKTATGYKLSISVETTRSSTKEITFPLTVVHEGARSTVDMTMSGQQLRFHHELDLGDRARSGWGYVELPADLNARDNIAYFAYGEEVHLKSLVAGPSSPVRRLLRVAAAPAPGILNHSADEVSPEKLADTKLSEAALIVWQGGIRAANDNAALKTFVEDGGVLVCYPTGNAADAGTSLFDLAGWGDTEKTTADKPWRIGSWNNEQGPLASTREGQELPMTDLACVQRQTIVNGGAVLASFEDGKPFLTRQTLGRGALYFCATLPAADWSNLDDGMVLVPMTQRMVDEGGGRLGGAMAVDCGEPLPGGVDAGWTRFDREGEGAAVGMPVLAGVYRREMQMAAVNRPVSEHLWEVIDESKARELFGAVPLRLFEEKGGASARLQSELWRTFLWVMLLLLIAEAALALPGRTDPTPAVNGAGRVMAMAGAGKGAG
jgi:hypothetical protein